MSNRAKGWLVATIISLGLWIIVFGFAFDGDAPRDPPRHASETEAMRGLAG